MCGRYMLTDPTRLRARDFGIERVLPLVPRWNIAPGQEVACVLHGREGRTMALLRWGLVPAWAKDPAIGDRLANARAETAHEKPAFRGAFRKHRCLLVADGYYEWQKVPGAARKQPYAIRRADHAPFAFAGLWDRWQPPEGDPLFTCTILTMDASPLLRPIHERMPVIVPPEGYDAWLAPGATVEEARAVLAAASGDGAFEATPVGTWVNAPVHDDPRCLEPATAG